MNDLLKMFEAIDDVELVQAIREIKEDTELGIIRSDGVVRKYAKLCSKFTLQPVGVNLSFAQDNILKQGAYRFVRKFAEIISAQTDTAPLVVKISEKASNEFWSGHCKGARYAVKQATKDTTRDTEGVDHTQAELYWIVTDGPEIGNVIPKSDCSIVGLVPFCPNKQVGAENCEWRGHTCFLCDC